MQITINVPNRVGAALTARAGEYEMNARDFLEHLLFTAGHAKEGVSLKLELLPPPPPEPMELLERAGVDLGAAAPEPVYVPTLRAEGESTGSSETPAP